MGEFQTYLAPTDKIELKNKRYHVFLSFRGKDTRDNLVDYMFEFLSAAGVHVFIDSKRIRRGENIGLTLKQAIEETVIRIPIFSQNYAQSRWCLWEVTEMSRSDGLIIPLFYGVDPTDVKYAETRPMYKNAFADHRKKGRVEKEKIDEWRDALFKVAHHSGWTTQTSDRNELKFIRGVVSDVLNTLKVSRLGVPRFAVGLKERMDAVIKLLKIDENQKVVTVGIWSAHGTGKSTLARAVYNDICRNFKVSSFVSDIAGSGPCKLQKQLLRDLLKRNSEECKINDVYHGQAILEEHLQSIRALVILDNVDNRKQIEMLGVEWLGKGSRVIVTTRDKSTLNVGEDEGDDQIYALQELKKEEALQLFSWHAFSKPYPDKKYKSLTQRIVDACGGLPSSLEVLGQFLGRRKDFRCWNEIPAQLQNASFDEIYRPLKVIYQDLNAEEKQIVLDIACFLVGQDLEAAICYWEDLNLNPHINLNNLVLKSLIKIDYKQEAVISMHDHLRDLGRAIVADESREHLSKRSRLWKPEDAYQVLHERPGFESVQSISLSGVGKSLAVLKAENMASMKKLQLLWLGDNTIEGELQPLPSNLRWFRWNSCPLSSLPSKWSMENLVILDLSSSNCKRVPSKIKQIWKEESEYKHAKNLKVLLLRRCLLLETLPDLSNHTRLVRIDLEDCSGLREIPQSIGLLLQLKWLNLCGCKDLGGLPESICKLSSLEKLYMNGCSSIRTLPTTFGELRGLKELDLGGLVLLEELPPFLTGCCLQKLILTGCQNLRNLPDSIGDLKQLIYLEMNDCGISCLPEEFGKLASLKELFLNDICRLEKLPESSGNLRNLRTFELRNAHCLTKLPENFSKLESLIHFDASFSNLACLPASIGDLSSLEILKLQGSSIEGLPGTLNQLKKLKTLSLNQCDKLIELPALPEALVKFKARGCKAIRSVVKISGLRNLTVMDLRNCQCLEELPNLSSLELLAKIDIRGCISMKNLADLRLGRLKSLQSLYLSRSDSIDLNLRQVVEDMPLFQRSNAQEEENHTLESNSFKDVISFPVERNPRCEGVLLFFELEFNSKGINSARMEIVFVIDEEETINGPTVDTEGEEQFILIFRATHELVVALEKARNLCVRAKGEGIHIRFVELRVSNEVQEAISENREANRGLGEEER